MAHGHLDVGMPQKLLDCLQAGSPHDQVRGEGVAEVMKAEVVYPCLAAGGAKGRLYTVEPAPLGITEHVRRFQLVRVTQLLQNFYQSPADRNMPGLAG